YGADGLLRRAASRPRDAGDRDADRGAEAPARAERHLACGLLGDGAEALERRGVDAHELGLRAVRVRHGRAEEVVGRAGDLREPRREEAARARLRERERLPRRAEQRADDALERLVVAAEDLLAEDGAEVALDPVEQRRGFVRRPLRAEVELDLARRREDR